MPRARDPNRDKAHELYKQHSGSITNREIANTLGVDEKIIAVWKQRDKWNVVQQSKESCTTSKSNNQSRSKKPIAKEVKQVMDNPELTDKQRLFCLYYSKNFNAPQSYAKAYGCTIESAAANAYRLMADDRVREELQALREIKMQQLSAGEADLVDLHMRIAFADIGEYVDIKERMLYINDFNKVDTQLIKEVKETEQGISIKLIDRYKSMDWLDRYFLIHPMDRHRIEYDKRKLELELIKLDYEAKKNEPNATTTGADNFLDALNAKAAEVWADDE